MRSEHQQRVDEFMRKAGQDVPEAPFIPDENTRLLRAKLIFEECMETIQKGLGVSISGTFERSNFTLEADSSFNMRETVDGCCDIKVVTTGTLTACGISDLEPQRLVDESNLAKFGPGGYRAGPNDPNGPEGKWIKPKDWQPPDLMAEVRRQSREAMKRTEG